MRLIKRYVSGDDVRQVKDRLVELGYLAKATHNRFGNDSYRATKAFQAANNLEADGIVGPLTWAALFAEDPIEPVPVPEHIAEPARSAIGRALATVSKERQELCLEALRWCVNDQSRLRCFYIRGGNLYDTDLTVHTMTEKRLSSYFSKKAYEPYYDGGRQQMMEQMAADSGYTIPGADCSGFIVGLWRHAKVVGTGFDATADKLYSNYCVATKSPMAGDLAHKSGHIGICVGAGYVVEDAGGAYGVQLTRTDSRKLWDYVRGKYVKQKAWDSFGDPKYY